MQAASTAASELAVARDRRVRRSIEVVVHGSLGVDALLVSMAMSTGRKGNEGGLPLAAPRHESKARQHAAGGARLHALQRVRLAVQHVEEE